MNLQELYTAILDDNKELIETNYIGKPIGFFVRQPFEDYTNLDLRQVNTIIIGVSRLKQRGYVVTYNLRNTQEMWNIKKLQFRFSDSFILFSNKYKSHTWDVNKFVLYKSKCSVCGQNLFSFVDNPLSCKEQIIKQIIM